MKILLLSTFLFAQTVIANILPELPWGRISIIVDGKVEKVNSEIEFFEKTFDKSVKYAKLDVVKDFECPVDALFWLFHSQLTTNSHYGDKEFKKLIKSCLISKKK